MKILLVNLHSAHNAGDAALLRAALAELRRVFPGCEVTLSMSDRHSYRGAEPVVSSFTGWFKEMAYDRNRWRPWAFVATPWLLLACLVTALSLRLLGRAIFLPLPPEQGDLLRAYAWADLVISNAGGYFYSSGRIGLPFMLAVAAAAYGALLGKPTYTLPQTLGPNTSERDRMLLRGLLPMLRLCQLRDEGSVLTLTQSRAMQSRAVVLPDLAFLYGEADEAGAGAQLAALSLPVQAPLLGLTVVDWGAQNRRFKTQALYEQAVADALRAWISATGGTAIFVPQVCGPLAADDDRVPARRVADLLGDMAEHVRVVEQPLPPPLLRSLYGHMDFFLGTRLHSNIFALTTGTPVVAVAYQAKTFGTLRLLGLEDRALAIEACRDDAVTKLLLAGWRDRDAIRAQIAAALPALQANARFAADLIRADVKAQQGRVS